MRLSWNHFTSFQAVLRKRIMWNQEELKIISFLLQPFISVCRHQYLSHLSVWVLATDTVGCLISIFSLQLTSIPKFISSGEVQLLPTEYSFCPSSAFNFCHKKHSHYSVNGGRPVSDPLCFQLVDFHFKRKTRNTFRFSHHEISSHHRWLWLSWHYTSLITFVFILCYFVFYKD